ncbi:MAG: shikimate kinase [Spirochaetota bacterium]
MSPLGTGRSPGGNHSTERKHIFLVGQKHAGKTSLGSGLAERWGITFLDLDDLIVELANVDHSVAAEDARAVYRRHGAEGFRGYEAQAAENLSRRLGYAPTTICSLGGGTVGNDRAFAALEAHGIFVYLYVEMNELYRRISQTGRPAFLSSNDPKEEFMRIAAQRDKLYRARADLVVDLDALDQTAALDTLDQHLQHYLQEHHIGRQ